MFAPANPTSD